MTEEDAEHLGRLRAVEIMELLLLAGRENELGRWARSEMTTEQVRRRLVADQCSAAAPARPRHVAAGPPSVVEAFAGRGLRLG